MKIALCGDSFCEDFVFPKDHPKWKMYDPPWRGYYSWTNLLQQHYDAKILQKGVGGDCLFHAYQKLTKVIAQADYIIVCITEPLRLANKYEAPMNIGISEKTVILDPEPMPNYKKLIKASNVYYKEIANFDFHYMAHHGILMQMDKLILENKKRVLWFPCFSASLQGYQIKSGPVADTDLMQIAEHNDPKLSYTNHFNKQQNINMFNLLRDYIDSGEAFFKKPGVINISEI